MKFVSKRILSWLLSLAMLASLLSGMSLLPAQAATVDYVYSGNYVYNWGEREELATFLSPMAEGFYADNKVTYMDLAALSGASSTSDVPDSALFDELHELMYSNLDNPTSYDATRSQFQYTDCENNGGSISSFYSGKAIGPAWDSGKTWNREHVWPNSKSNGGSNSNTQRETDIMMLRPASVSENSSRSNTAYGEGSKFYDPNELGQNVRGDAARIVLYVYVCWGGSSSHDGALNYMWGASGVIESKEILLKWMKEDPVDTWELGRNDAVQAITGTRNVFVDYPELAFKLFNEDVPAGYDSPSGGAAVSYTVSASTNNTNYGTVAVSGRTITATPKTGYAVSGYTILSGSATVTRDGNTFKVTPTSDVSIRINFAKRNQATVQFSQLSSVVSNQTAYVGDTITLPAHSGTVPIGYTFVGWSEQTVEETATKPVVYAAGSSFTVGANAVLYAVYSRFEGNGSGGNVYSLYSGAITEGDYIIVYKNNAMTAAIASSRFANTAVTATNNTITDPDASIVWHIAPNGDYWNIYNVSTNKYAASTGAKNKGQLLSSGTDNKSLWTVTGTGTYEFVNKANKTANTNANLRNNGTYGFACYSTSTGGALTLYKRASGATYYFTGSACDHSYTAATCTEPKTCTLCGVQVGEALGHTYDHDCDTTCNRCGAVRTTQHTYDNACDAACNVCGAVRTPASHVYDNACDATCNVCGASRTPADHVYDNACDATCNVCGASRTVADHVCTSQVTTAATCGKVGVRTYTCVVCGHSYTESIPATGAHTYTGACDADCDECGATRTPAAHTYTADCDTVCDVCGYERSVGVGGEVSITFDDTSKRTQFTTSIQVWEENGIIVTNTKSSSSSAVADYANPARFYKGSSLTIEYPGMAKIVFNCNTSAYATDLKTSIGDAAAVEGKVVTVELDGVDKYEITLSGGQVRVNSIVVTNQGQGAEHTYSGVCDATCNACGTVREAAEHAYTATETSATCGTDGVRTYTCAQCGDSYTETIPATGQHTYDDEYDADCNDCGDKREVPEKPVDVLYGDADGDGDITVGDVVILQQFLAEWGGIEIDMVAADADGDGDVTVGDVVILQQFLAEWDVTLGP